MIRVVVTCFILITAIQEAYSQKNDLGTKVYEESIKKGDSIGGEWKLKAVHDCSPAIETSPKGGRVFIARIPTGKQSLNLSKLPKHTHIRVKFDLILTGTWDGGHHGWGPDLWRFGIDDNPSIIYSSFCNQSADMHQSFPDFHDSGYQSNKSYTGSLSHQTLGYDLNDNNINQDSVYRFDFIVPHTRASLKLNFESIFNDVGEPEPDLTQWYGLDNIVVSSLMNPPQLTAEEIRKNLLLLVSAKATQCYEARLKLIASDKSLLKFLEQEFKGNTPVNVSQLIEDLNASDFFTREKASLKLTGLGVSCMSILKQELAKTTQPEVISRIKEILQGFKKTTPRNYDNEVIRLLKIINTPASREILKMKFSDSK